MTGIGSVQSIPLVGGFFVDPSVPIANQDCVNLMPYTPVADGAASRSNLVQTDGIDSWVDLGSAFPVTDLIFYKGEVYAACYGIYKVDTFGTPTYIGGYGVSQLASNGEILMGLVKGSLSITCTAYFYDPTNGIREVTDSVFQDYCAVPMDLSGLAGVLSICSHDGYFVCCTQYDMFHSTNVTDPDQGTTFPALAYAQGESRPDNNRKVMNIRGDIVLFGEKSYEQWRDVATEPFAYQRLEGATQDKGVSVFAPVVQADNTFFFSGNGDSQTPGAWRHTGGAPQKISTQAVDAVFNSHPAQTAWSYSMNGHIFVGFETNATNVGCLVYDVTESILKGVPTWHRRSYLLSSYHVVSTLSRYNSIIVGCRLGRIGRISTASTEFGERITRSFVGPYLRAFGNRFSVNEVRLYCEAGTGLTGYTKPEQDSNPKALLEYSKDSGRTWKSKGERSMGRSGEYGKVPTHRLLGQCSDRTLLRYTFETKAKVALNSLEVEIEGQGR